MYPTKLFVTLWFILACFNFFFFLKITNNWQYLSLGITIYCIWTMFSHLREGNKHNARIKEIKNKEDSSNERSDDDSSS
jgi:predicted tellurium resistance membrane protein TerC